MILILPCAGESTRFPGTRPKWLLTQPNGNLMVFDSIAKLDLANVDKIVLIAVEKQVIEQKVDIQRAFAKSGIDKNIEVFLLKEKTSSQPETISKFLNSCDDDFPFFVKDCDNQFCAKLESKNEVFFDEISSLHNDVTSKSYCKLNERLHVIAIAEKQVISSNFCVGGYSFRSSKEFMASYRSIQHHENIYISHIIEHMLLNGKNFYGKKVSQYQDWGTLQDWLSYKEKFSTIFIDIDGVIVKNSSEFISPIWGETEGIVNNINTINSLFDDGKTQIILTTARTEEYKKQTINQLKSCGLKYHQIIFGMLHAKRKIINDYSTTNPYPSCESISILRNSEVLCDILK